MPMNSLTRALALLFQLDIDLSYIIDTLGFKKVEPGQKVALTIKTLA